MTTRRRREEEVDDWELDSGLVDDIDIWITKSRFGYLENYMNGEVALLIWDFESPDAESEYPIIWPCGGGWEVRDRGLRVEHPKRQRFVRTSILGRMIERVTKGLEVDMRGRGSAKDARIWEGLGFHVKSEALEFKGAAERGLREQVDHLMPIEFLGERGKVAPARRPKAEVAEGAPVSGLEERLRNLAQTQDLKTFQKAAMNIEELQRPENSALLADVLEDEEGLWARVRAES